MTLTALRASCSIVCYNNTLAQIEQLLSDLTTDAPQLRLYVVDNSIHEWLPALAQRFGARYLHRPDNPGFGHSHNLAIRDALATGSDYHFVANPDVHFSGPVIAPLLEYMENHAEIGLLAPRVLYPDGCLQYLCKLLPTPEHLLIRRFLPVLHRHSTSNADYELRGSGYDQVMDVPALSGCFMLIRCDTMRRTGLFDERFFMYFEDVDLSRRIGSIARTVFFPHVCIIHEYNKGSYKEVRLLMHHIISAVRYFNKWGWFSDSEREAINGAAVERLLGVKK
jgi:GT2 family glycosyltransferase